MTTPDDMPEVKLPEGTPTASQPQTEEDWATKIQSARSTVESAEEAQLLESVDPSGSVTPVSEQPGSMVAGSATAKAAPAAMPSALDALDAEMSSTEQAEVQKEAPVESPDKEPVVDEALTAETAFRVVHELDSMTRDPRLEDDLPADDLSMRLGAIVGDLDAARTRLDQIEEQYGKGAIRRALADPNSELRNFTTAVGALQRSVAGATLAYWQETNPELTPMVEAPAQLRNATNHGKGMGGKPTGLDAKVSIAARLTGMHRVKLLNSGFWVMLKPFDISMLYGFYRTVINEANEFGRDIGLMYFDFNDYHLKRRFVEFFISSVVRSNLATYDQPGVLELAISMQDYDTCMWAICMMIHPQVTLGLRCANPECNFRLEKQTVDTKNLRIDNYRHVDKQAVIDIFSKPQVTVAEVMEYQNRPEFKRTLTYPHPLGNGETRFDLSIPSLHTFLSRAEKLVNTATTSAKYIDTADDAARNEVYQISVHRMLWPWVSSFTVHQPGEEDLVIEDPTDLLEALDESYAHTRPTLPQDINRFIMDTRISAIAYTIAKCPKCGAGPHSDTDYNGLVPVNLSYLFFVLASKMVQSIQA